MAQEPLTKYIERAKSLWSELTASGLEIQESEICWSTLSGLPSEYDMVVTVLNHTAADLTLEGILPDLMQLEQQRSSRETVVPIFGAHMKRGGDQRNRTCHYCGKPGHIIKHCRQRLAEEANTVCF